MGKQQRAELRNRWSVLIAHLLKWEYQLDHRSRSCLNTIRIQRIDTLELVAENPSLKPYLQEVLQKAYIKAIVLASVKRFPQDCPYTVEDILSVRFFPGSPATDEIIE